MAISSPLLEDVSIAGAEAVLVNICGGEGLGIHTVSEAMNIINEAVGGDANVIFGAVIDPELVNSVRITVIATGFGMPPLEEKVTETVRQSARRSYGADFLPGRAATEGPVAEKRLVAASGVNRERWERVQGHGGLDVPAFIRKQMD
jgi:cell division protein FtsZ